MAKKFDPATLFAKSFQRRAGLTVYPTDGEALDAVKSGRKGMEMWESRVGSLSGGDLTFAVRESFARDLVVVLTPSSHVPDWPIERQTVRVFQSRPEELWRIPAMLALWDTAFVDGRWSSASENLASLLLGYTPAQRKKWLDSFRHDQPAWGCASIYALLDDEQRVVVESVGRRCFGTAESLTGMTLFHDWAGYGVKPDAHRRVPRGRTLARAGLRWAEFKQLFGSFASIRKARKKAVEVVVPKKLAAKVSGALLSNVQFLTKRGWS